MPSVAGILDHLQHLEVQAGVLLPAEVHHTGTDPFRWEESLEMSDFARTAGARQGYWAEDRPS